MASSLHKSDIELEKRDHAPVLKSIDTPNKKGETLPGWTIMRPLKMRGLKSKNKGSASSALNGNAGDIDGYEGDGARDGKHMGNETSGVGEADALADLRSDDELLSGDENGETRRANNGVGAGSGETEGGSPRVYKVYKRRWFGLVQLVLLNIVVSWDVSDILFCMQCKISTNAMSSGSPGLRTRLQLHNTTISRPPS